MVCITIPESVRLPRLLGRLAPSGSCPERGDGITGVGPPQYFFRGARRETSPKGAVLAAGLHAHCGGKPWSKL